MTPREALELFGPKAHRCPMGHWFGVEYGYPRCPVCGLEGLDACWCGRVKMRGAACHATSDGFNHRLDRCGPPDAPQSKEPSEEGSERRGEA